MHVPLKRVELCSCGVRSFAISETTASVCDETIEGVSELERGWKSAIEREGGGKLERDDGKWCGECRC